YKETVANWISDQKIPLKKLGLSNKELVDLAPFLTYLDLTDGRYDANDVLIDCIFTEQFIGNLLKNSSNCEHLIISHCNITGKALNQFKTAQKLQALTISNCPEFNQPLPTLNGLHKLTIMSCHKFNQKFPASMDKLETLGIMRCMSFNQA